LELFDLQKSIRLLSPLAPGILNNEEALDVKLSPWGELFDPLKQTIRAPFSSFWLRDRRFMRLVATPLT
jgi:hypothetical protein